MKVWIVTIFLLVLTAVAVWVVLKGVFSSGGVSASQQYDIPEGRYDYYMVAMNLNRSPHFPDVHPASGRMSFPPGAACVETEEYLGRKFTVGVYHQDKDFARQVAGKAMRKIEDLCRMADPSNEESELFRINRDAAERPVVLSEDMYHLLTRALEIADKSDGDFDPTAGPLRKLYAECVDRGMLPSPEEINEAVPRIGWKNIQLSELKGKHVIRFAKPGVTLDLHDLIGGFCLDQAVYTMRLETITTAYLNVGDVWRLMDPPNAETGGRWILGIPDSRPEHPGQVSGTFQCGPGAVACKGYYSGFRFVGTSIVTEIVNPHSGTCVGGIGVCAVFGPDALSCDAMSCAGVVLGAAEIDFFFKKFNPPEEEVKKKPVEE